MKKGEIYIVELFSKEGKEQSGIRPAILMADTKTSLALIIPLTSNMSALNKLPFTIKIEKNQKNNLEKDSVALTFQLQAIDKKRLKKKIGFLESDKIKEINDSIKDLIDI